MEAAREEFDKLLLEDAKSGDVDAARFLLKRLYAA
jgi:hypothetical protein